jgi:DNA-binding CsgD family transcriptional regulator
MAPEYRGDWERLTEKQRPVYRELLYSDQDIKTMAGTLNLSVGTTYGYMYRIFKLLGVKTRQALMLREITRLRGLMV